MVADGNMEQHIARLVSACGLPRFDYRAWPATEIVIAPPAMPEAEAALPEMAAELAPDLAPDSVAEPTGAVAEAPATTAPAGVIQAQPELSGAKPPRISLPSPIPPKPAEAESGVRTRSLLTSLTKLIESPPPRIVIAEPAVAPMGPQGIDRRAQEPPRRTSPGYEAPVHVGYLPAPAPPPKPHPLAPTRRFALLDEIAVARRRVDPRRGASPTPPD